MADQHEPKQEATLRDFVNVVFRRKWLILSIVVTATVIVVYLNGKQSVMYESGSRILIERGKQMSGMTGAVRYLPWAEEVSSQIEVIMSHEVFQRAQEIFADSAAARGVPDTWRFNPGAVRADVVGESNAFVIVYVDFVPDMCKLGCEAMTQGFVAYYRDQRMAPELSDFFAEEIVDVRTELDHWEVKRNDFLNQEKFFGLAQESRFLLSKISRLETQLLQMKGDLTEQRLRTENLERMRRKSGRELEDELAFSVSSQMLQSSLISRIKFSLQTLDLSREELMQKFTESHPEIVAIDEQVIGLHADLEREIENSYRMENEVLKGHYARRASVLEELSDSRSKLDAMPDKDMELTQIDNRIEMLRDRYNMLLTNQSQSDIAMLCTPVW